VYCCWASRASRPGSIARSDSWCLWRNAKCSAAYAYEVGPFPNFGQLIVMGEIERRRRHQHHGLFDGAKIGIVGEVRRTAGRPDPVYRLTVGCAAANHGFRRVPLAQTRDTQAIE